MTRLRASKHSCSRVKKAHVSTVITLGQQPTLAWTPTVLDYEGDEDGPIGPTRKRRRVDSLIPSSQSTLLCFSVPKPYAEHPPIVAPPPFSGGYFDVYAMPLELLRNTLKPESKSSSLDYASLYAKLRSLQSKNDKSARLSLRLPPLSDYGRGYGRFSSPMSGFTEPLGDDPYDIGLTSVTRNSSLSLSPHEQSKFWPDYPHGEGGGVTSYVTLAEDMCGVSEVSGHMKLFTTPVWRKESGEEDTFYDEAIFRGFISLEVQYGSLYRRKGFGDGNSSSFAFWCIPALEDTQLECDDLAHLANF